MVDSVKFWNFLANRYAKTPVRDEISYQEKLGKTREYLHPDMEVFEFGCGTGTTAIYHAPHVKQIHAVDSSSRMIEIARGKASERGIANILFECAAIENVRKPDNFVDVVMAHSILHLVPGVEDIVGRVYRMLKPGGVFVSSTACLGDMNSLVRGIIRVLRWVRLAPYIGILSGRRLQEIITGAGFTTEHVWQPRKNAALFIIARKVAGNGKTGSGPG